MAGTSVRRVGRARIAGRSAGLVQVAAAASMLAVLTICAGAAAQEAGKSRNMAVGVACTTSAKRDVRYSERLGNRLCRVEFDISTQAKAMDDVIGTYSLAGIRVQPLAGFQGRMPTAVDAVRLRSWALRFGPGGTFWRGKKKRVPIANIEFGNETSYSYQYGHSGTWASSSELSDRARLYALRAKTASIALQGTGVGLLVQAEDGDAKNAVWVNSMFDAVPDLASRVSGWTIHPYGEAGFAKIDRMIADLAARNAPASIPIYITEWGLATGNGHDLSKNYGYPTDMTYSQAAATLRSVMTRWRTAYNGRIAQVIYYMLTDLAPPGSTAEGERFFGLLKVDGSRKGPYTFEARAQIEAASGLPALPRAPAIAARPATAASR